MGENSVTVTNNESNVFNVQISTDTSLLNIESAALYTTAIVEHNAKTDAHSNVILPLKDDIFEINQNLQSLNSSLQTKANSSDVIASLSTKANQSTTYTKTEVDTAMSNKLNTADSTVTKQGNSFNGNSQLIQTTSAGKYPALDGSLITNLPTYIPKGYSHIVNCATISTTIVTAGTFVGITSADLLAQDSTADITWANGIGTCVTAGKYKVSLDATLNCATASQALRIALFKNGALATNSPNSTLAVTANSFYPIALNGIIDLAVGNTIQIGVTDMTAVHPVVINAVNLVLQRIA